MNNLVFYSGKWRTKKSLEKRRIKDRKIKKEKYKNDPIHREEKLRARAAHRSENIERERHRYYVYKYSGNKELIKTRLMVEELKRRIYGQNKNIIE